MIGIISAMTLETEMLINKSSFDITETITGIDFHKIEIEGKEVVLAVSGVGKVNAARVAEAMILKYNPDFIINTGVAGGLNPELSIGDIVLSRELVQHDMDTSALGDPVGFLSTPPLVYLPANTDLLKKAEKAAAELNFKTISGIIASGDKFVSEETDRERIIENFSADACEMEGAAIAQVCYLSGVPFLVIRAISDGGNSDSPMDYPTFARLAAEKGADLLRKFISL
jgi:adenosylhomocysteine nucleosidase